MTLCCSCGLDFAGIGAFDAHRTGVHAYTFAQGMAMSPPREDGRRCLDAAEMELGGWTRNRRGLWTTRESIRRGRAFSVKPRSA